MPTAELNRRVVQEFYDLAFVRKRYAEAADAYFGDRYIQHNAFVADGIDAFKEHFGTSQAHLSPDYVQRPLRFIADEDLVAVHVWLRRHAEDSGIVLVDIFRLENGKIVEHWDVGMPIPDEDTIPHRNGVL
ncbi:nuclear transport factor 2 family protein [Streptosporangium saharense]|uniref:nuclear transport factor 2 family protein n=1 Tax=Streptosporangium saharense TaxID=1706840 RepID=UPI00343FA796